MLDRPGLCEDSGEALACLGYPRSIRFADSADRARIRGVSPGKPVQMTVRPGRDSLLEGAGVIPVPRIPID